MRLVDFGWTVRRITTARVPSNTSSTSLQLRQRNSPVTPGCDSSSIRRYPVPQLEELGSDFRIKLPYSPAGNWPDVGAASATTLADETGYQIRQANLIRPEADVVSCQRHVKVASALRRKASSLGRKRKRAFPTSGGDQAAASRRDAGLDRKELEWALQLQTFVTGRRDPVASNRNTTGPLKPNAGSITYMVEAWLADGRTSSDSSSQHLTTAGNLRCTFARRNRPL